MTDKVKDIYVKGDIHIDRKDFSIEDGQTLHIAENAVLSVDTLNFMIRGDLINDGDISILGIGRIIFHKEPTKIGDISSAVDKTDYFSGEIGYIISELTLSEVKYILDGDLPYNSISVASGQEYIFVVDEDYTLEEGNAIWLNINTTLKVAKGVTFTIKGMLTTYNEPIIEGTVIGNLNLQLQK